MIVNYNTRDTCSIIGVERHVLKALREVGLLVGRKQGKGFFYDSEEVSEYIRMTRGYDLSSADKIKFYAPIILRQWEKQKGAE